MQKRRGDEKCAEIRRIASFNMPAIWTCQSFPGCTLAFGAVARGFKAAGGVTVEGAGACDGTLLVGFSATA